MAVGPVILPTSGHAAWDDLATWWLSRYKISTQQTYATYLPRWTAWCARHGVHPLQAGRADVERWLRTVADSGLSRASLAAHYDAVASIYRLALEESLVDVNPARAPSGRLQGTTARPVDLSGRLRLWGSAIGDCSGLLAPRHPRCPSSPTHVGSV